MYFQIEFEKELQKDEIVIIDKTSIALRDKILLTNKRLIIFKPKGFLSSTFVKRYELPLSEIIEAHTDFIRRSQANLMMILTLKNGEQQEILFDPGTRIEILGTTGEIASRMNAITEKWVNAINRAIGK